MCGRYTYWDSQTIESYYHCRSSTSIPAHFNVTPHAFIPVITAQLGASTLTYILEVMQWGFVPAWTNPENHHGFINARSESIATKKSFKEAFKTSRCIIPARGFYEWKVLAHKKKQPYYITTQSQHMAFAGVFDRGDNSILPTVAIITKDSDSLQHIHHRMPVVLDTKDTIKEWLMPTTCTEVLQNIMVQSSDNTFISHTVANRVNKSTKQY